LKTQWNLFLAFFRAGMLGYGGGPASIPLVHKEVVEKYKWMTNEEFGDLLAIANTLPGPIATKLAGYVGYRVAGIFGLLNGVLTSVLPTVILLNLLLTVLSSFREIDWVKGMTAAVIPVVGMMMVTLTWQFFDKARKGMGWVKTITLTAILFIFLSLLDVHPGIMIAVLIILAFVIQDKKREKGVND
jgi:chromate transporter